jgi:hypothetical protein
MCVCVFPQSNFDYLNRILLNLVRISWHLSLSQRRTSLSSICETLLYSIIARQRFGKNVSAATNTRNNRRNVGRSVFFAVRIV